MPAPVVLAEKVSPEVAGRIAPDGMDVVRVVLGVVMLDQQARAVEAEVMGVARVRRACPGEVDGAHARLADTRPLRLCKLGAQVADEFLDQTLGVGALRGAHLRDGNPDRGSQSLAAAGTGDDIAQGPGADDRPRSVLGSEAADDLTGEILLRAEHPFPLERT